MIKPSKLKKGDTVGIVAPASSFDKDNFKKGIKVLRQLGYKIKYERSIFNDCWSKPGHDKERAFQINRMFKDKEVKAILCAKAGYGSHNIISSLDLTVIKNNPKIFVGYSDITILLLYLQYASNMVVFHGPVISGEFFKGMNPETLDSFTRLLGEDKAFGGIASAQIKVLKQGKATGPIVGGNLTLIMESIGTPYEMQTEERILFIEEINESREEILTELENLRRNGKLTGIKGIIFGRMTDCFEDEDEFFRGLKEFFKTVKYPILYNFPSGHTEDIAHSHISLPLGIPIHIDSKKPCVEVIESAVS
jgi:muramoyltetrapeptide carboxypeptidase